MKIGQLNKLLDIGWDLLSELPESEMKRIKPEYIAKYRKKCLQRRRCLERWKKGRESKVIKEDVFNFEY